MEKTDTKKEKKLEKETNWKCIALLFIFLTAAFATMYFREYLLQPAKLDPEEATVRALSYINAEQLDLDTTAMIVDIIETSGVYELKVLLRKGEDTINVTSYITLDGKFFFQGGFEIES